MTEVSINLTFPSELHISDDFDPAGGPTWPGANSTTCTNARTLSSSASYKAVNTACGSSSAWADFRNKVEAHEREHETNYNACLRSQSAAMMLAKVEMATGTQADVLKDIKKHWTDWWKKTFAVSGYAAAGRASAPFWKYRGGWWRGTHGFVSDGGARGC